jgi:DNA-binding cell septation regulator SpoVG
MEKDGLGEAQIKFTVNKMYCLPDAGKLKAFFDMAVNDVLIIKGARIIEGKKGLFVCMPQEQGKDSKWYDQFVITSATAYDYFSNVALEHYRKAVHVY